MALKPKPNPTTAKHLAAIRAGEVDRSNVNGIRKLLNGAARREAGYPVGMSTPKGTMEEADEVLAELEHRRPKVVGDLHETGLKLLRDLDHAFGHNAQIESASFVGVVCGDAELDVHS